MAAFTCGMAGQSGDALELPRVARLADGSVRAFEHERVRRMALLAADARMKLRIGGRRLVAGAAVTR
jgi:hypothetical protein